MEIGIGKVSLVSSSHRVSYLAPFVTTEMKLHTVLCIVAAVVVALMVFAPESEAKIPRKKMQALKKLGLVALLLKGKKKILFPLPLPLPLPVP